MTRQRIGESRIPSSARKRCPHCRIVLGIAEGRCLVLGRAPPGGTHASSPEGVAHLTTSLIAWNPLHASSAHLIAPTLRFRCPQPVDAPKLARIKALDQEVCQPRARFARQLQSLLSQPFDSVRQRARYGISSLGVTMRGRDSRRAPTATSPSFASGKLTMPKPPPERLVSSAKPVWHTGFRRYDIVVGFYGVSLGWPAAVQGVVNRGQNLVDGDVAIAVHIPRPTQRNVGAAEGDVDQREDLVDRHLGVAVTITGARVCGCRGECRRSRGCALRTWSR